MIKFLSIIDVKLSHISSII